MEVSFWKIVMNQQIISLCCHKSISQWNFLGEGGPGSEGAGAIAFVRHPA
jgi:hypothetical protein